MKADYKQPRGVNDFLPDECYVKNRIEQKIMECFKARAFARVETPAIEYYAMQKSGAGAAADSELFKFVDTDGSLLSLRADMTRPIARLISSKINPDRLLKFCYLADSFALSAPNNREREFTQAGVEVVGKSSAEIDAQTIALAIDALKSAGLCDFLMDIGQVGYFKGLIESLSLDGGRESEFISLADKKDMLGLLQFSKRNGIEEEGLNRVLRLPELFGGEEILDEAYALAACETSRRAICDLKEINEILKTLGYSKYISYDLSIVNGVSYYTGVVYKGLSEYFGAPLCSGGRYSVSDAEGKQIPATGFAIGIGALTKAIAKSGKLPEIPKPDYAVGYEKGAIKDARALIDKLISDGFVVDEAYAVSREELAEYKKAGGAAKAVYVEADGETEL